MGFWVAALGIWSCVYRPEPPKGEITDVVIGHCDGCPITDVTCGAYAHGLTTFDVVAQCELLSYWSEGNRRGARHVVREILVGFSRAETLSTILPAYRTSLILPGARTIVWQYRQEGSAGNFAVIGSDDKILFNYTTPESHWRKKYPPVKYSPVRQAVLKTRTALSLFEGAEAVLLARLDAGTRWAILENGGTWRIDSLVRVVGSPTVMPISVSFGHPRADAGHDEIRRDDLFLIPVPHGNRDSTVTVDVFSRPLVVRNGISLGFGVSVDSLDQAFDIEAGRVHVRQSVH